MPIYFFRFLFQFNFFRKHYFAFYAYCLDRLKWFKHSTPLIKYDQDIQIQLHLSDFIQQQIFFLGYYDLAGITYLKNTLREGDIFIDIGANIGSFSLIASKQVQSTGKVYAFEPVHQTFEQLTYNYSLNHFTQTLLIQKALADKKGHLELNVSNQSNTGMSSMLNHDAETGQIEKVPCITLDDFVEENNISTINLIKMDIEGAEYLALLGMSHILKHIRPTLMIELNEAIIQKNPAQHQKLLALMASYRYCLKGIDRDGNMCETNATNLNDSENFLFIPQEIL